MVLCSIFELNHVLNDTIKVINEKKKLKYSNIVPHANFANKKNENLPKTFRKLDIQALVPYSAIAE